MTTDIAGDSHWTAAGAPYLISSDVAITNGASLIVDAGVDIFIAADVNFVVQSGSLRMLGTAEDPIRVRSSKLHAGETAAAGDWGNWIVDAGAASVELKHVLFQHGSGLVFHGAAATLDYVAISDESGAAITADLAASLSGIGNSASGNAFNAIVLPAGDIAGSTRWGLRGIPYLVSHGVVSVGSSPKITAINPIAIPAGDTTTVDLQGERLSGPASATFSRPGLSADILPGGSDTRLSLSVHAASDTELGQSDLRLLVDAGVVEEPNAFTVARSEPTLVGLDPSSVLTGRDDYVLVLSGTHFLSTSEVELDGVPLATAYVSETELRATLPTQSAAATREIRVRTPDGSGGSFLTGGVTLNVAQPTATASPFPVSMIDGYAADVTLTIPYPAPAGGLQFSLASSAPLIAEVPNTVTIPEGESSVEFSVQGRSVGNANISVTRVGWSDLLFTVTVSEPPRTLDFTPVTSPLVGVQVGDGSSIAGESFGPVVAPPVGIAVGAIAKMVTPTLGIVETSVNLSVTGIGLDAVTALALEPSTGVSVGAPNIAADGSSLTATLMIDADAPIGVRRVVLSTATGEIPFADSRNSQFRVVTPAPELESITPQVIEAGKPEVTLIVRGTNLRNITGVRFEPADGLSVVGDITASADGRTLTFAVQASVDAVTGSRVVVVGTDGGESTATQLAGNAIYVAHQVAGPYQSLSSAPVGVVVGGGQSTPVTTTYGPILANIVGVYVGGAPAAEQKSITPIASPATGVLVGSAVTHVEPHSGSVGTAITLQIQGVGLDTASSIVLTPDTGLQLGTPTVNADGSLLSLPVTIVEDASRTTRVLKLVTAANKVIPFADVSDSQFLVAAPKPELISITPQSIVAGDGPVLLTVRGRNLRDITDVRVEPAGDTSVVGSYSANVDGTELDVNVEAVSGATSGSRTLVVASAGGESDLTPAAGNTFQVVQQITGTRAAISSAPVGVSVGDPITAPVPLRDVYALPTGVVVGGALLSAGPRGAVPGSSGTWTFQGIDLSGVTEVRITGNDGSASIGVTAGSPLVSPDGTQVTVGYSVAGDAPAMLYRLDLAAGANVLPLIAPGTNLWRVLDSPVIDSVSPTVLQQGKSYTFTVRGQNLDYVESLDFEPSDDIEIDHGALTLGSDSYSQFLTVRLLLETDAPTGTRVLRLGFPGGQTSAQATTANTISVVPPQ